MATTAERRQLEKMGSASDLPPEARDVCKPGALEARTKPMKLTEQIGNAPLIWNPVFNRGMNPVCLASVDELARHCKLYLSWHDVM